MDERAMPIYVRVEEYKDVLDVINLVKNKLVDTKDLLNRINELKSKEDAELEKWHFEMDEVERKIDFIDRTLFEPDSA